MAAHQSPPPSAPHGGFPIAGIGASAGGLEALRDLLGALPANTGMGFVVVQHLSPERESGLAEILSRATRMQVCEVVAETIVQPDHVYVITPGRDLILAQGSLCLLPQEHQGPPAGIDRFFRSLAQDAGHLAIGIVLSGNARDGTIGLEEIKGAGGFTFAQDESAHFESMPRNAVASGCVDFVLSPQEIAGELARIARHPYVAADAAPAPGERPRNHARIAELVTRATAVDFTHYKANTLRRRIDRRMMLHRLETPREYEDLLRRTPVEVQALYQDLLIGVTSFFRNPEDFMVLKRDVIPKLLAASPRCEPIRIWTAGCATGEEAYSLAIVFAECAEMLGSATRLQLFATDVNPASVERARAGLYPRSIVQDVSPQRLLHFFAEESGGYRIRKSIREACVFSRHNLAADPPFSRLDFISCRNLLIYFEPVLQQKVLSLFHYGLKPAGLLWLGGSESVSAARELFEVTDPRCKIFARQPGGPSAAARVAVSPGGRFRSEPMAPRPEHGALHRDAERLLLAKYAPPGVIVSAQLQIIRFQGDTSPFLAPAAGAATMDLSSMLREGLAPGLQNALQRAARENVAVRVEGLRVRSGGAGRTLAIEVIPIREAAGQDRGFVVLFDEAGRSEARSGRISALAAWWRRFRGADPGLAASRDDQILQLTQELQSARQSLQAEIEQHEAAHEELQSANEEAQSANEELQSNNEELETSKEEIEASNEELATLNDELASQNREMQRLNEELSIARDYAQCVVDSVRSPLLVLDAALRVRTASRAFYDYFHVAPAETEGRYLYDLGERQWDIPTLRTLLEEVLPRQKAVEDFAVRHTFAQLGPRVMLINARRLQQAVGSAPHIILSIEDVTARSLAEEALRQNESLFAAIIDQAPGAVFVLDPQLCFQQLNPKTRAVFGHLGPLIGRPFAEAMETLWGGEVGGKIMAIFRATLETGERYLSPRFTARRQDLGEEQTYDYEIQRVNLPAGGHGVICYFIDITERTRAAEALRASEQQFAGIFNQSTGGIAEMDLHGRFVLVNDRFCHLLGRARAEVLRLRLHDVIHPEDLAGSIEQLDSLIEGNLPSFVLEKRYLRPDGSALWAQTDLAAILDTEGRVHSLSAAVTDITERRLLEDSLVERAGDLARADRSKDEFLAMLAHELRNPLAPLRNAVEILQTAGATPGEHAHAQQVIGRQIENMSRMIDDLLDVSRITEGKIELQKNPIALAAILTAAASLARSACAAHHQHLEVALPSEPIYLNADATRLEQVFGNLLGNACKYSGDGSHISITAERIADLDPPEIIVRVRDDGIGIEPGLLPRVFDLFVQATRALDRAHGGLGIGLTLVRRLVELHGGAVEARSGGLGCGSEFIVRLPILRQAPPPSAEPPPATPEIPRRILIVDDNTDSARTMAVLQARRGHVTRTASNGPEAIAVAAEFLPEVVLLDIGLPGMDGFEVARRLRQMPALDGALLIAMTGYAAIEDRIAAIQAGFDEHLVKPVDLNTMRGLLQDRVQSR